MKKSKFTDGQITFAFQPGQQPYMFVRDGLKKIAQNI